MPIHLKNMKLALFCFFEAISKLAFETKTATGVWTSHYFKRQSHTFNMIPPQILTLDCWLWCLDASLDLPTKTRLFTIFVLNWNHVPCMIIRNFKPNVDISITIISYIHPVSMYNNSCMTSCNPRFISSDVGCSYSCSCDVTRRLALNGWQKWGQATG